MSIQVLDLIAPAHAPRKSAPDSAASDAPAFGSLVGDAAADEGRSAVLPIKGVTVAPPARAPGEAVGETPLPGETLAGIEMALLLGPQPVPVAPQPAPNDGAPAETALSVVLPEEVPPTADAPASLPPAMDEAEDSAPVAGETATRAPATPGPGGKDGPGGEDMSRPTDQNAKIATVPAATVEVAPPPAGAMLRDLEILRREGVVEVRGSVRAADAAAPDAARTPRAADKAGRSFAEMFAAASGADARREALASEGRPGEAMPVAGPDRAVGAEHAPRVHHINPQASAQAAAQSVPIAALSGEIAARAAKGMTQFEIRLDPPELGRIDVSLKIDGDGQVISRLVVERAETLDLLKADQRALERALEQAGLRTEQGSLQFELRDGRGGRAGTGESPVPRAAASEGADAAAVVQAHQSAGRNGASGLDMRI